MALPACALSAGALGWLSAGQMWERFTKMLDAVETSFYINIGEQLVKYRNGIVPEISENVILVKK